MSDDQQPPDVGSLGEEAAKLFGALADVARQHSGDATGGLGSLAGQAAGFAKEVNDHLATDAAECRYCPICRCVHVVRSTTPEVKAHLYTAATSLLQAAMGLMETIPPPQGTTPRGPGVERIDLDTDDTDDTDDPDSTDPGV
jgi:hypothetical protein